jgi:hypothetical protein
MKSKSGILFCLIFIFILQETYAQYISPGIRLGYDFNSHITMGLKVSVGAGLNNTVVNFTFGKKFALTNDSSYTDHRYIDLQVGTFNIYLKKRKIDLFSGGGIGLISYEENGKTIYHPRITCFVGYLFFTTLDINIINWKNFKPDLGLQLVLPIPLGGFDIGAPGG